MSQITIPNNNTIYTVFLDYMFENENELFNIQIEAPNSCTVDDFIQFCIEPLNIEIK